MELQKLSLNDIKVGFDKDQKRWFLVDGQLKHSWVLFHNNSAILRYTSKQGNRLSSDFGYRRQKRLEKLQALATQENPVENSKEEERHVIGYRS